jgi:excisionase family DNA binding protein
MFAETKPAPIADPGRLLLTVGETAEALVLSERSIWNLIKSGELPAVRIGRSVRISRESLIGFIQQRQTPVMN